MNEETAPTIAPTRIADVSSAIASGLSYLCTGVNRGYSDSGCVESPWARFLRALSALNVWDSEHETQHERSQGLAMRVHFATTSGALHDGDIIRDDRSDPLYRVVFRQDFGWDCFEVGGKPDDYGFILTEDGPHIEGIGNIYQNPELLS